MKIDLKSALCGLAVGLLAMFAIGATTPTSDPGRYRITGSGTYFLLVDTQTGRVWTVNFMATNKNTDGDFFQAKQ